MISISNNKADFHNIEDSVLLMRNCESSIYDVFYSMESVAKQLSMDETDSNCFDQFRQNFNNFIIEFDCFKNHHQTFVNDFIEINSFFESTNEENFLSRCASAICDFEEFNDIDVNLHAIDFANISCFQSDYKRLKNCYQTFLEYYVRINQHYLQFKEDSNKILKIAQWNCDGLEGKENELLKYVNSENLDIILLQNTRRNKSFRIPGYITKKNEYPKIGTVLTLINEKICTDPKNISINTSDKFTDFQVLKLSLENLQLAIVNVYSPYALNSDFDLSPFLPFLTENSLIVGYFNAYSTLWGDDITNFLGKQIESILSCDFHLLNDATPTCLHQTGGKIGDFSLCTNSLRSHISWRVDDCNLESNRKIIRMDINITELCEFL